ncbi:MULTISPECIES: phosphoribosylanthranilate isomerase [unclassified Rathayibacter]|uniref:phosphoribosylanthranilate isomerase n=1 Tax=unclassified Rathayibacter TaxID=2609250 RepID=UPI000CE86DE6|nr:MULTISPECIES: phosphoribosylanthranilate isomerase [unclassified Rathayibacter]PPG04430.1 phosphoribosylanthranilate isomerase [Rathayibacter sp. AY2B1]PPG68453.1 phosphoribosylanthranilate isomerase [Rathayibacter sp. AY1F4]
MTRTPSNEIDLSVPGTPWIKICGLTTPETVRAAVGAGADAVGFVFAAGSPRLLRSEDAAVLRRHVPADVEVVGVFRRQSVGEISQIARTVGLDAVQLHGGEGADVIDAVLQLGVPVIQALSMDDYLLMRQNSTVPDPRARLLLDAPDPGSGSLGRVDELAQHRPDAPWLLAGGLNPGNVRRLVEGLRPFGVDVSSGVEESRGVKSVQLIRDFIRAARGGLAPERSR